MLRIRWIALCVSNRCLLAWARREARASSASAPRIQLHDLLFRNSIAYHIRVFSCPSVFFYWWFYTVEIVAPVHGCAWHQLRGQLQRSALELSYNRPPFCLHLVLIEQRLFGFAKPSATLGFKRMSVVLLLTHIGPLLSSFMKESQLGN